MNRPEGLKHDVAAKLELLAGYKWGTAANGIPVAIKVNGRWWKCEEVDGEPTWEEIPEGTTQDAEPYDTHPFYD